MNKIPFILILSFSYAQTVSGYAYTGTESTAMAGAVVAEEGNNWSIFHNPAGITEIKDIQFNAGGGNLYGFSWLPSYNLSGIVPLKKIGKFGVAFQQLETKHSETTLSTEQTLSLAQGFDIQHDKNSHLAIGYTLNLVLWDLGKSAGISGDGKYGWELGSLNAVTVDFGVLASLREKYRFGVFLKNINSGALGQELTRQVLPQRINVGITYMPLSMLSTSIVSERLLGRNDLQIKGAIRYSLNSFLELYTGLQSNPNRIGFGFKISSDDIHNLKGKNLSFTYGLLTHPVLPMTQQLSIGFEL